MIRTMTDNRSLRGLPPDDALKRWADPILYSAMIEYNEWSQHLGFGKGHPLAETYPPKHKEYWRRREAAEASMTAKLLSAEILGSGLLKEARSREIIDPSLWDVLYIDFDSDAVRGNGLVYEEAEFFDPTAPPRNVAPLLERLGPLKESYFYTHGSSYRHVTAGGVIFPLGDEQRKVVRFLHEKLLANDRWQPVSAIQEGAGIRSSVMSDLFGSKAHWERLLISDTRRYYSLRDREGMVIASADRKPTQTEP